MDANQKLKRFGERLKELRLIAGLSQEALALEGGLDRSYVGGIERGERNVSLLNILLLAETLKISPAEFFTERSKV